MIIVGKFTVSSGIKTPVWDKTLGGDYDDKAFSMQTTSDGGCIVAGTSYSSNGDVTGHHVSNSTSDIWVCKISSNGGTQWGYSFGGTNNDGAYSIKEFLGGYVIGGYSYSNDYDAFSNIYSHQGSSSTSDCWFIRTDINGNITSQRQTGGALGEGCNSVATFSNRFIGAGGTYSTTVTQFHGNGQSPDMYFADFEPNNAHFTLAGPGCGGLKSTLFNLYDDNENPPLLIDQEYTDDNGECEFDNLFNGVYSITASVDYEWGGVNSTDAAKINLHYNSEELIQSSLGLHVADVDNSFEVNSDDATKIIRRFVGLDDSFDRGEWVIEKPFGGDTINVSEGMNDTIVVDGNEVYQEFYASCVGDVNGSYIPDGEDTGALVSLDLTSTEGLSADKYYNLQFKLYDDLVFQGKKSII